MRRRGRKALTLARTRMRGFSLVEVMVALLVLSVGMLGIAAMHGRGLGAGRTAMYRSIAVNLAADMADRIRVNRLAGAAYAGAASDEDCDIADCTPAEMAAHDLFLWNAQVEQQLPNGQGIVQYNAATMPPTYTITVDWDETGIDVDPYVLVVQVPEL